MMKKMLIAFRSAADRIWYALRLGIRSKLILIFLLVSAVPLLILALMSWQQIAHLGGDVREIAVTDSSAALNESAVENIERMTTDTAQRVASFLYDRDDDILYLAALEPTEENYRSFIQTHVGLVMQPGEWVLNAEGTAWVPAQAQDAPLTDAVSTNSENNDMDGFRYRHPETTTSVPMPLYDEITFVDLDGNELVKVVADGSSKVHYPLTPQRRNVAQRENTYVKAETYFPALAAMRPGDIYVSDVVGAYVRSNYIGMYAPEVLAQVAQARGYDIPYAPEAQAYAGEENPNGQRFEGIVRWATPVADADGQTIGYVTFALNHDHIMEFVDHQTPMNERYTQLPSAFDGNYAFIWDYQCRSICHPRHHSIVGFDPETGDPEVPWLETSIYEAWQQSEVARWDEFLTGWPTFDAQSRQKAPAAALTRAGLVGLDGRYLNNAPQCTGWMDLTADGGSGSFYILWSGLYKLTTAAAIPYYTGQYAPSEQNDYSRRGFGIVTIGAGLEDFTRPAQETEEKLGVAVRENLVNTTQGLLTTTLVIILLVMMVALWLASFLTHNITRLIQGVSRFRSGERHFRFDAVEKDEFSILADSFDEMADSIVDSVRNPMAIIDTEQRILYMNDPGLTICRKQLPEIIGTLYSQNSIYPVGSACDPIKALEEHREAEVFYEENSGRYMQGTANYFLSKAGEKLGYIISSIDVTDMVRAQQALEKAVEDANNANAHKGEFLARMSHEIRTPMNAIIGMSAIAQRKLDAVQREGANVGGVRDSLSQIDSSSQHLLGLLNDILDLSKIEAGKIDLSEETVELLKLAETVAAIIRPRCEEKNITFRCTFPQLTVGTFQSDSLRLRQVLINLLGNAVKFTPELGLVAFEIEALERRDDRVLLRFAVRDSGIGIAPEALGAIFQAFEQGGNSITRQYGGTGLGLAISRHMVNLFGGDITVESEVGQGSTFSFSIWLREVQADALAEEVFTLAENQFAGKRALLVDDVDINRMIVVSMLEETGLAIDEAEDGAQALAAFRAAPPRTYDIILMDVQMPNMNGYEASDAIRALDRPDASTVPIIALTANAFKDDIDRARQHGMNAHLAKPVEMDKLLAMLYRHLVRHA